MFGKIAAFEFRYQVKSPLFIAAAILFFLAAFIDMSVQKLATSAGGNVLFNAPHYIIIHHIMVSLLFLFVGAAFVSNIVVRDDQTGFGPLIRTTRVTKFDYLFGRFAGALAVGALLAATVPLGSWLGALMPFADQEMLGPNRLSGFAYGYGLFALPNVLIISAILFALATTTRSTAGTFIGVIGLAVFYLVGQRLMEGETLLLTFRVLADPFGMSSYMAASRYLTAVELNAGAVPVTNLMIQSRLLWMGLAIALLALTYHLFRFSERGISRRRERKLRRQEAMAAPSPAAAGTADLSRLAQPHFGSRTAFKQFVARAAMEARFILMSPAFLILLIIAFALTLTGVLSATSSYADLALYPATFISVPIIEASFDTILIVIATYYGGELVWRERERKIHEIIGATPIPAWALMLPKMAGLALVLLATLLAGMVAGIVAQLLEGGVDIALDEYMLWYLLPDGVDAILVAVLAVFVQVLSPGKYVGWGIMAIYILLSIFGPSIGLEYPLFIYGNVPAVPLSDMAGAGPGWEAAWWFRLFWGAVAALLLLVAHLLWPRGAEQPLKPRLRRIPAQLNRPTRMAATVATALFVLSGSWILYNTLILNSFATSEDSNAYFAEYEKRYLRYASLAQPTVRHADLDVALYPEELRANVRGSYRLVNETEAPIDQVHVRLLNPGVKLLDLDLPGARLERNDEDFGYRIYRFERPIQPGEARSLYFRTRRQQAGFRAAGAETGLAPNGTDLNSLELTPRIGMSDNGLIEDPIVRREHGLAERHPLPRLDDLAATEITPNADLSWITADITVSTSANQIAVAPGKRVSERVENGRRIARFVSDTPIKNNVSIQSARYAVKRQRHYGIEQEIYYHPAHHWNIDRMMTAMTASMDYYDRAFGHYPFDQIRVAETPSYRRFGGQAFPNSIVVGEGVFAQDLRSQGEFDLVTMMTAHELAHQWWGHQVLGARMQGLSVMIETLAQYSALMVMKKLYGEDGMRQFFAFQRDRYLSGRRTQVVDEEPLISVGMNQDYVDYGKGALVFYLLHERIGEEAVNRALRRFVDRYRFTEAPYPRSVDLVRMLRQEANTPENQALITDLFERITLYDLKMEGPKIAKRSDGKWEVTVPVTAKKFHANGKGTKREAPLDESIEIAFFVKHPNASGFGPRDLIGSEWRRVRSGRQIFRFVTSRKPGYAGIDPNGLYIDRSFEDNFSPVSE